MSAIREEPYATRGYSRASGRRNGMGTAALVIGVVALVLAVLIIFSPLAGLLGIIAAVLGFIGIQRVRRGEADNNSHAVAGVVTGLIALAMAIIIGVRVATYVNDHLGDFRRFGTCITSAPTKAEQNRCGRQLANAFE